MISLAVVAALVLPLPQEAAVDSSRIPDDRLFMEQRSFYAPGVALDAPRAWALTSGSPRVVEAVLDDGFFYQHEDIAGNVWRNIPARRARTPTASRAVRAALAGGR